MKAQELPGYMERCLDNMKSDGLKESYIKRSRSDLRAFQKWIDTVNDGQESSTEWIRQLTKEDYTELVSWLSVHYSDASVNRICTVVAKLLQFLGVKNGFALKNLVEVPKTFPLKKKDFVANREYSLLLESFRLSQNVPDLYKSAHKELSNRNISILYLMRFYGLTPAQISRISMKDINFTHNELQVDHDGHITKLKLTLKHKKQIYSYLLDIPEDRRPHFQTEAPLFVAYNNTSMSFQIDNDKSIDKVVPQRLAERSIMKLLQVEIKRSGIHQVSSTHFRNRAILDAIESGMEDRKVMNVFGITSSRNLRRYKDYLAKLS
jgi:site-specific recombinase XerD